VWNIFYGFIIFFFFLHKSTAKKQKKNEFSINLYKHLCFFSVLILFLGRFFRAIRYISLPKAAEDVASITSAIKKLE
jgi:hypothetical protein